MLINEIALDRHRRAVEGSVDVVSGVGLADLALPTPCAGWTVADLLEHMTVQHTGFAAAARGETTGLDDWAPRPLPGNFGPAYADAAGEVVAAFAGCDAAAMLWLPEIRGGVHVPATTALGFHLVDYVVHAWDVAASLGVPLRVDDDVLAAALAVARQVPDDETRVAPGAAFAPSLPAPSGIGRDGDDLATLLRLLGRDPGWGLTSAP